MRQKDEMNELSDVLSPLAKRILDIDPTGAYRELVVRGEGNTEAAALLRSATPEQLLLQSPANRDEGKALLSALWLWHDWLDESHTISQGIETPTGSFWHAIMHRREGDFSNSKYWYARCLNHPVLSALSTAAPELITTHKQILPRSLQGGWDPKAFVDFAESAERSADPAHKSAASELQQLEWRILFKHTLRAATAV